MKPERKPPELSLSSAVSEPGPLTVGDDGRIRNELRFCDPDHWEMTYVSFGGNFGSYGPQLFASAPDLLALLIESKQSTGGDWRKRRDALIAKIEEAQNQAQRSKTTGGGG